MTLPILNCLQILLESPPEALLETVRASEQQAYLVVAMRSQQMQRLVMWAEKNIPVSASCAVWYLRGRFRNILPMTWKMAEHAAYAFASRTDGCEGWKRMSLLVFSPLSHLDFYCLRGCY